MLSKIKEKISLVHVLNLFSYNIFILLDLIEGTIYILMLSHFSNNSINLTPYLLTFSVEIQHGQAFLIW